MNFNTTNSTFRQVMGNGLTYRVPPFQRDYSWDEEHWDDLWQDLLGLLEGGESMHYMGYLVLQSVDNKQHAIIDGQQRLTTLSVMILAVLAMMRALIECGQDAEDNRRRESQLRGTYIGYLDPVSLATQSKLALNRHNDEFYQLELVPAGTPRARRLNPSEKLLRRAYHWFRERLADHFGPDMTGQDLARFVDVLADRLFFTAITVSDELNAYRVFETLNARGVRLSSTDLLKNYLFSLVSSGPTADLEMLERRWEVIVGKLGSEGLPDFLRTHWNSRHRLVRKAELFKAIRREITTREAAFGLLRDLDRDADIYAALCNPDDELWAPAARKHVRELRLFRVTQPYALLLAAHRALSEAEFTKLLRACAVISFRYNVIGRYNANDQEVAYNKAAVAIAAGELRTAGAIAQALRQVYVEDDKFINLFADKELRTTDTRNNRVARYILFRLEAQASRTEYDFDSDTYSVEHVLPESPGAEWEAFGEHEQDQYVYRLGNLTLLAKSTNRAIGNAGYAAKREHYRLAQFEITRKLADENAEWTTERVNARQRWMAKQANSIWRIDV